MENLGGLSKKQDTELVELLRKGSQAALGELYARYKKQLVYFCRQYLKNEADAEDIVHDIFLKLLETCHSLGTVSSFSGLLQTMAKNYITDQFRHLDVHTRFARKIRSNGTEATNETENTIMDNDYMELLHQLIEKLPLKQKEIFRLSSIKGLTYQEISEVLQMPVGNVRRYASIASNKMKNHLQHTDIYLQILVIILTLFS